MSGEHGGGRDTAGVILVPPLIFLLFLIAGGALTAVAPAPIFGPSWLSLRLVLGGALAVAGGALAIVADRRFKAAGTATNPLRPTTAFVVSGPYRFTRNPMYLGLSAVYLGIGIALDSAWIVVLMAPLLIVIEHGVVRREERYLAGKFGDQYRDYCTRVRRWI